MSPYWGANFFEFFALFFTRLFHGMWAHPATDEIQIGTLCMTAISCGLIGPFLVLRKMTMFANSLSHTILLGIAGTIFFFGKEAPFDLLHLLVGALLAALFTALLTEGLIKGFRLQEDASIGLVFTSLFSLGIVFVTLFTRDLHLGLESVVGNVDALRLSDFRASALLALLNFSLITLFYRQFQIGSFDRGLAKALGSWSSLFHYLLLFLTAITCIGAFRAIGVILVLAFLVGPFLTARLFFHRLKSLLLASILLGCLASLLGVAFSRHLLTTFGLPLSTGGLVVCFIGLLYILSYIVKKIYRSGIVLSKAHD